MADTTHTPTDLPEALRLADKLNSLCVAEFAWPTLNEAAIRLRRYHARVEELEAQVSALSAAAPQPPAALPGEQDARDAAFEAVRQKLWTVPRYSFALDSRGNVRRCEDKCGNWIEFDAAHELFDPVAVDSAIAAKGRADGGAA